MLDFDGDMWRYISDGWFVQENKKGEIGSSTMPQKVNPIDFENSEGNAKLGNAMLDGIIHSLAVSRLQRDLSGSTILRNIGTALAYSFLAINSSITGTERISAHEKEIKRTLNENWTILGEAVQTLLRQQGTPDAYTKVLQLSRGKTLSEKEWMAMIKDLPIDASVRKELQKLTPETYLGYAIRLTELALEEVAV